MILFTKQQIDEAAFGTHVPCKCDRCGTLFTHKILYIRRMLRKTNYAAYTVRCSRKCLGGLIINWINKTCAQCGIQFNIKQDKKTSSGKKFCSKKCKDDHPQIQPTDFARKENGNLKTNCGQCKKEIMVIGWRHKKNKTGFSFCNSKCSAAYINKRRANKGYQKSKLEIYISKELNTQYPFLKIEYNEKKTIGYELDIYIPELKFAVEVNGIFHYKAINGDAKLARTQEIDKEKLELCSKADIDLLVINTMNVQFSINSSKPFLEKIYNKIDEKLNDSKYSISYCISYCI